MPIGGEEWSSELKIPLSLCFKAEEGGRDGSESEELRIRSLQTEPAKNFSTNLVLWQMPSAVSDESRVTYGTGNLHQCDIVCYGCPLNN